MNERTTKMKNTTRKYLLREFLGLFVEEWVPIVEKSPPPPPASVPQTPTFSVADDRRDPSSQAFASENRDISNLFFVFFNGQRGKGEKEQKPRQQKRSRDVSNLM